MRKRKKGNIKRKEGARGARGKKVLEEKCKEVVHRNCKVKKLTRDGGWMPECYQIFQGHVPHSPHREEQPTEERMRMRM